MKKRKNNCSYISQGLYLSQMNATKTYFGYFFYYFFGKKPGMLLLRLK